MTVKWASANVHRGGFVRIAPCRISFYDAEKCSAADGQSELRAPWHRLGEASLPASPSTPLHRR